MTRSARHALLAPALLLVPIVAAHAQAEGPARQFHVALGGAFLTSGAYFTGPGSLEVTTGSAFAGVLQAGVEVSRTLSVVLGAAYSRPDWSLNGVPLIGSLGLPGPGLWFADAALRGRVPLGSASRAPQVFAQVGAGVAHYSLSGRVVGRNIDEQAMNFAVALGVGIALPLSRRVGLELMGKDYITSLKSVRDLESFGVDGKRAHTILLSASVRLGL